MQPKNRYRNQTIKYVQCFKLQFVMVVCGVLVQVRELVQQTEMALGPVDLLVNCAGVMYYTCMKNIHQDEWDHMIDVNCKVWPLLLFLEHFQSAFLSVTLCTCSSYWASRSIWIFCHMLCFRF